MKKKHLTYGKKTLSVFLAALMLMTCWVFVAPEKAEAADSVSATESYNKNMLNEINTAVDYNVDTTGNYYMFRIYGDGDNSGANTTARQQKYYKNVLSHDAGESLVGDQNRGSYFTNVTNSELTVSIVYPTMVLKYDGVTTPKFGIMLEADSSSGKKIRFERAWMDANSNGLSFNPNYWLGIASNDSAFFYIMEDAATKYLYAQDTSNGNVFSARSNGQWEFLAASLEFTGTMSANEWVRTISPTWKFYNGSTTYTGTNTSTIYVMNFKAYGELLTQINNKKNELLSNAAYYTPESIRAFVNAAKNIINCNPKNYTAIANAPTWGNNMTTYYNTYNTAVSNLKTRAFDVTFENLFSINNWYNSESFSYNSSNGEVAVESHSTIKIYKSVTGGELTTGSSYPNAHSDSRYSIPVTGGKDYTVSFNTTSSVSGGTIVPEVFLFWYDVNNDPVNNTDGSATFNNKAFSGNGDHSATFTAPATATKAEIRFDNDCSLGASTLRFNNIAVYPAERAAEIELETWGNRPYTKAYTYKAALGSTLTVPTRAGYAFNGWYLDSNNNDAMDSGETVADGNGTVVSNLQSFGIDNHYNLKADWVLAEYTLTFDGNGGTASTPSMTYDITDTVTMPGATRDSYAFDGWKVTTAVGNWVAGDFYNVNDKVTGKYGNATLAAQWTKNWTVTFLDGDGSTLYTVTVKNGGAATPPVATPTKASDENGKYTFSYWDTDYSNVTEDMTVKPVFTQNPHTVAYTFLSDRTCEKNAIVKKYCSKCGYSFFERGYYDGTTEATWLALGHNYTEIVVGSDYTEEYHTVRCSRYSECGSTTTASHNFNTVESTEGANCITAGTVTEKCTCGQTRKVTGETAPDVHDNTRLINVKDPTCTEDGYTGDTYCDDCQQTVATGEVDPKLGHSFTNYVYNNDAKCEKDGTETAKCDRCDVTDTRTKTGSALEHKYTNYVYNNDAECEVNGTKTASCDHGCDKKDTIEAEGTALEHDYTGAIKNNGDGTHSYLCRNNCGKYGGTVDCSSWKENATEVKCECKDCGYTKTHAWGEWAPSSDNSGSAAGKMTRTCSDCSATETSDCTYKQSAHSDATCTAPERTTYTCTECGHGYTVIVKEATGHKFTGKYKYNADTDTHQQLCANGCNTYGVGEFANAMTSCSWNYVNKEEGKHTATCVCGNSEEQECSGGTATCTDKAECQHCKKAYGTTAAHSFKGTVKVLEGDVHAYLCEYCNTDSIYGVGTTQNKTEACSGGDATCTVYAVCEKCSDTYGALDTEDHKWCETPVADAGNAGKHIYTCEYNGEHKKSEACESGSSVVVAPKCEEDGYTIQTCKECSYQWHTDPVTATGHKWGDLASGNDGTHTYTCKNNCGETKTENCEDWKKQSGVAPSTCTEQGYTVYECDVCAHTWNDNYTAPLGHSYVNKVGSLDAAYKRSDKTCTEAETYWYRCDNCTVSAGTEADKYADNLASIYWSNGKPAGHNMQKLVDETDLSKNRKSEADCNNPAIYYYSCSVCGEKDTTQTFTYKAKLDHDYQDIVDENNPEKNRVSEATCTSPAIYNKSCSRCGDVSAETFEYGKKIGHSMTKTEAKEPTCTEAGNVEYYTCSNCNKTFSDEDGENAISKTEISALGHDTVTVPFKAATCEEDGHAEYTECKRCHEGALTPDKIYPATGHKFTGAYTYDAVNGYHSRYCVNKNCLADGEKAHGIDGVKYSVEYDGLDYVIKGGEPCTFKKDSVASTDENGIHSHKLICVCGNESSKAYADDETFVETVDPNCTDKGYDVHECPDCNEEWHKNFVDALGHDLSATATPNGDGTHSVKCNRDGCDHEEDAVDCSTETPSTTCGSKNICDVCHGEFGEAIEHVFTDYKYNDDATCTEDGTKTAECDNCDTNATHTVTATGTKLGHDMTAYGYSTEDWSFKPTDFSEDIKAPTCSEEGLSISYCTRCDNYRTKVVKADTNAHVWKYDLDDTTDWDYAGGDCSIGVTLKNPCTVCGIAKTVVETGNHDWHATYSFEPTCTQPGIRREVCYVCEAEQVITCDDDPTLAPVEHTYGEETSVPANCTEAAHKEQTCTVCGFVNKYDFDEVFGVQHAFNKGVEYEATCETIGYKEYTCSECNYVEKVKTSDALGHKDANGDKKCDECFGKMYDDSDSSKGCGCICHKESWLMRIIYKILRFFWKLFKISKSCECGAVHW